MKADEIREAAEETACREDMEVGLRAELRVAFEAGARWALRRVREHLLLWLEHDPTNDDWCDKQVLSNAIKECICKIEEC